MVFPVKTLIKVSGHVSVSPALRRNGGARGSVESTTTGFSKRSRYRLDAMGWAETGQISSCRIGKTESLEYHRRDRSDPVIMKISKAVEYKRKDYRSKSPQPGLDDFLLVPPLDCLEDF